MNTNIFHVMKDPVHDTMQFTAIEDRWIKPFIDHPIFQRLRHIKQLGMGDFIFPGAVHTRFNHCIGCCYVGSRIAEKINLAEEERQMVMIACLLHDIGHGPFSHAFEDLFEQKAIHHEAWTPYFLHEFRSNLFFKTYNQQNPRYHLTEEKFREIENMIMHRPTNKRVLADIVSSQLDADRLDYLLRDSHFCGVVYGQFDFRWMIHAMTIIQTEQGERLGLTHKGIGVVEHYLMARRLMMRNIYHHQKKLAFEFFLVEFLSSLAQSLFEKQFENIRQTKLGKFLFAVNQFNQAILSGENIAKTRETFLQQYYPIYCELCDYDVFAVIRELANSHHTHKTIALAKRLHYRKMPHIIRLESLAEIKQAEIFIENFRAKNHPKIADWQLTLIKAPYQSYSTTADPILIQNEHNMVRPLEVISFMIQALSQQAEHTSFLCVDDDIFEEKWIKEIFKHFSG